MEKPNWEPRGGPNVTALHPWPSLITQSWDALLWSKGVPASVSMPGSTSSSRGPDHVHHYEGASVVTEPRGNHMWANNQLWHSHHSQRHLRTCILPVNSQIRRVAWPCVDTVGQICWCYCHCLNKDKADNDQGDTSLNIIISLTLINPVAHSQGKLSNHKVVLDN